MSFYFISKCAVLRGEWIQPPSLRVRGPGEETVAGPVQDQRLSPSGGEQRGERAPRHRRGVLHELRQADGSYVIVRAHSSFHFTFPEFIQLLLCLFLEAEKSIICNTTTRARLIFLINFDFSVKMRSPAFEKKEIHER